MLIVVDPSSGVPVFRQIMDQVKLHVASGQLEAGAELPPTRTLSLELGVNPMTVSKAYGLLERDGILVRRPGRPLVVKALETEEIENRKLEELRKSLAGPVRVARQLGVEHEQVISIVREMLAERPSHIGTTEES